MPAEEFLPSAKAPQKCPNCRHSICRCSNMGCHVFSEDAEGFAELRILQTECDPEHTVGACRPTVWNNVEAPSGRPLPNGWHHGCFDLDEQRGNRCWNRECREQRYRRRGMHPSGEPSVTRSVGYAKLPKAATQMVLQVPVLQVRRRLGAVLQHLVCLNVAV